MNFRRNNIRFFVLSLLLAVQFGAVAHAVEYGVVEHEHEGLLCVYTLSNDDDQDVIETSNPEFVGVFDNNVWRPLDVIFTVSATHFFTPPSTGPPL